MIWRNFFFSEREFLVFPHCDSHTKIFVKVTFLQKNSLKELISQNIFRWGQISVISETGIPREIIFSVKSTFLLNKSLKSWFHGKLAKIANFVFTKKSYISWFDEKNCNHLEFDSNAGEPGFKLFSSSFSSTLSLVIDGSLMAALGLSPDLSTLSLVSSITTSSSSSETLSLFSGFWASFCSSLALLLIVGLGISVLLRPL